MDFLDSIKELADSATKNVAYISKSTSVKIEIKMKIRDLKRELDNIQYEIKEGHEKIGKLFVDEYKNSKEMDENIVRELILNIEDMMEKEELLNKEIKALEKELEKKLEDIEKEKM